MPAKFTSLTAVLASLLLMSICDAWVISSSNTLQSVGTLAVKTTSSSLAAVTPSNKDTPDSINNNVDNILMPFGRRSFFVNSLAATFTTLSVLAASPSLALAVTGLKKVNAELAGYGFPTINSVPDGLTPLLQLYGRGDNRFPILVNFAYPNTWIVTYPSLNNNGEDGTVQAGEYAKGDTATFFVYSDQGHVDDLRNNKATIEKALQKCISQKGDNMYQNFKVTNIVAGPTPDYTLVDFKYQLLTGAGFEVDRKGVASLTSQGPAVEVLWAASTSIRYKKTEETLRNIVASFRCYTEGLGFSKDLIE